MLRATTKASKLQLQAALLGSAQAIATYQVSLDGRRVANLRAGRSPFSVTLRKRGRVVRIDALNAAGQVLASAQRRGDSKLRAGKRGCQAAARSIGAVDPS